MGNSKPFMFDNSFDLAALKAAEEAKAVKTYSEEEVKALREQAYTEGMMAGREAVTAENNRHQADVLTKINGTFEKLAADIFKGQGEQKRIAAEIALAIAHKIMPTYIRQHGLEEMTASIQGCIAEMISEPRLVLRVHEKNFDFVKREVDTITGRLGYGGKMIILADQTLGENDCRIEWADGGMELNENSTWTEVDKQVARHMAAPAPSQNPGAHAPAATPSTSTTNFAV